MNHCQERGQPCPREPNFQDSRTRLSALLSVDGSWSQCMRKKRKRALHERSLHTSPPLWERYEVGGRAMCDSKLDGIVRHVPPHPVPLPQGEGTASQAIELLTLRS